MMLFPKEGVLITTPKKFDMLDFINRRRKQILVHSCVYYRFGTSIISDDKFDTWGYQLVDAELSHPKLAEKADYHEVFKDFDGSTGYYLPIGEPEIVNIAHRLIKMKEDNYGGNFR